MSLILTVWLVDVVAVALTVGYVAGRSWVEERRRKRLALPPARVVRR